MQANSPWEEFINTKLEDGTSIQSPVKIFSEIFSNLAAIGDTLENDDKVFYLLCSLPEIFDMIVATFENSDNMPDFEVVVQKLMEQDAKQRERCEVIKSATQALVSKINNEKTWTYCKKNVGYFILIWRKVNLSNRCHQINPLKFRIMKKQRNVKKTLDLIESEIFCLNNCSYSDWIIDSGASSHMTNNKELLENYCRLENEVLIKVGDGGKLRSTFSTIHWTVTIIVEINGTTKILILSDVLYVPGLGFNLISVKKCRYKQRTFCCIFFK